MARSSTATKKAPDAYIHFIRTSVDLFNRFYPRERTMTFDEMAPVCATKWRSLTTQHKAAFQQVAAAAANLQAAAMSIRSSSDVGSASSTATSNEGQRKIMQAVGKPRRASTAYWFFCNENRAKVAQANPTWKYAQVRTHLGRMYKQLAPSKKNRYLKMRERDKARFAKELERLMDDDADEAQHSGSSIESDEDE